MKAFRYKTATPEERRAHRQELNAKHERARIRHLAMSALRFIQDKDYRRGCRIVTQWAECESDLIRLVNAEIAKGTTDSIHIPRRVATAYISE